MHSQSNIIQRQMLFLLVPFFFFLLHNAENKALAFAPRYAPIHRSLSSVSPGLRKALSLAKDAPSPTSSSNRKIPFIVETVPDYPNSRVFAEIARMCIAAFFNDDNRTKYNNNNNKIPPWKQAQLGYLRTLQQSDLERRHYTLADANVMLVARRVVPADPILVLRGSTPLILDLTQVYNLPLPSQQQMASASNNNENDAYYNIGVSSTGDYVRGEIVGFVEVTKKPFGLGLEALKQTTKMMGVQASSSSSSTNGHGSDSCSETSPLPLPIQWSLNNYTRPVLTNLSVVRAARQSGVGTQLVARCEQEVRRRWHRHELVLEVEQDNHPALAFYQKRGYEILFEDPASRRYDVSGFWLSQKRCKRYIMRKTWHPNGAEAIGEEVRLTLNKGMEVWGKGMETLRKLRDTVLASNNA
jgi:ribosomal protein S18 acetylase RimI-like enzyme